jgi:MraZ protein
MIGKYPAKVDDKNRLFVPAKLRSELGETFYLTIGVNGGHKCLTAYTAQGWQNVCDKYDALPLSQKSGATSLLFIFASECAPDKQFRFGLTQSLMDYAGITRDVVIVGRAGQAEIWDADSFAAFESEALTPQKLLESLEAIGL